MNILIYTQKSNYRDVSVGGAETSLRNLAEALARRGHNVHYLTDLDWGRFYRYRHELRNGVHLHLAGYPNLPSKGWAPLLRLRARVAQHYFKKTVERIVRANHIDLVHTYHEVPFMKDILELREQKGMNYVTVLRNGGKFWVQQIKKDPGLKQDYRYVFNTVDSINFNTGGMKILFEDACKELGLTVNPNHIAIQDIGLNISHLKGRWKVREKAKHQPFKLIMASRFSGHQKRQDLLINAVRHLPDSFPFELLLIGDGEKRAEIEGRVRLWNLDQRVRVIPFMDQEKLWNEMETADLYVHACDFEGLSKIIIEAMAMGPPVLASDVTPLRDYISHGETGFLTENSSESWAASIQSVLSDRELLDRVSENAREYIDEHYNAEKNVLKYESYFGNLISGSE